MNLKIAFGIKDVLNKVFIKLCWTRLGLCLDRKSLVDDLMGIIRWLLVIYITLTPSTTFWSKHTFRHNQPYIL
jgi:hypothetical protein